MASGCPRLLPAHTCTRFLCYSRSLEHVPSLLPLVLPCGPAWCHGIWEVLTTDSQCWLRMWQPLTDLLGPSLSDPFFQELGSTVTRLSLVA